MLLDLGMKREDMPLYGAGLPPLETPQAATLEARLAVALRRPEGKERWAALQKLSQEFPHSLPMQAILVRYACDSRGGSVRVGHSEEIARLSPPLPPPTSYAYGTGMGGMLATPTRPTPPVIDPADIRRMLISCAAGERREPDNAYFPAMAAIAYAAASRDAEMLAALHRAARKPLWNEHRDFERQAGERRAELLHASAGSTGKLLRQTISENNLFPSLARLAVVRAIDAEIRGDIALGLSIRRDVRSLGQVMQSGSTELVSCLVGAMVEGCAAKRPGGAPALQEEDAPEKTQRRYVAYLREHGTPGEAAAWEYSLHRRAVLREIGRAQQSLVFSETIRETQLRALTSLVFSGTVGLLTLIAGFALTLARAGKRWAFLLAPLFLLALAGLGWATLGTITDQLTAFSLVQQGGCGCGEPTPEEKKEEIPPALSTVFSPSPYLELTEVGLMVSVPVTLLLWLFLIAVLGNRPGKPSRGALFRATILPMTALFALIYAAHALAFGLREHAIHAEVDRMHVHEGRYLAETLGRRWPE
jgi:hypothetical protein